MHTKLTVKQGLEIQADHLAEWQGKLSPECFASLAEWINIENHKREYESGYDVPRGETLTGFVCNWKPSDTFKFSKTDRRTEMQRDQFYNFCVTNLETSEKFWTDNILESKEAAKSVEISLIWNTKENNKELL